MNPCSLVDCYPECRAHCSPHSWQCVAHFWNGNFEDYGDESHIEETLHPAFFFFFLRGIRKIYVYFLSYVNEHGWEKQPINNEMVITDG